MLDKNGLHLRAAFFHFIRSFFRSQGFLEVDTPIRQPVYIPESNIVPLTSEKEYLQTSPELCMKRLLAAGNEKIFQICRCFRKEEKGRFHLEEFQMLEWYRSGADYNQLMIDCEALLRFVKENLNDQLVKSGFNSYQIFPGSNLDGQWERLTIEDAFSKYSPIKLDQAMTEGQFDEILVEYIEPHLGNVSPVFLYDYPVKLGSLARKKAANPAVAERFELYIKGVELANGFSELTDADEQRQRFVHEIAIIKSNSERDAMMPDRFLADLGNLETAAGIAMGIDRLFMMSLNYHKIAESVAFAPDDFV